MIPIVFAAAAFPDETGLVASYARPGANVMGVAFIGPEYVKRLEFLREVSPHLARVALLDHDHNPASIRALKETRAGAERLGVVLEPYGIHRKEDVETVFAAIARNLPGGLMTTADPLSPRIGGRSSSSRPSTGSWRSIPTGTSFSSAG